MENEKLRTIFCELAVKHKSVAGERLLSRFIEEYSDVLAVKIRYYLGEREHLVEEVLFEVFLDVWRQGSQLASIKTPVGWLMVLCRNKALSQTRRENKYGAEVVKLLDSHGDVEEPRTLFDEVVYRDYLDFIEEGVLELPDQQRKVYIMRHFDDLSIASISNLLKIGQPTVKRHLYLARISLRERKGHIRKEGL